MKGKFERLKYQKYADSKSLHFFKTVSVHEKFTVCVSLDFKQHASHFSNYPYIIEGLSYDLMGEFEVIAKNVDAGNKGKRDQHVVHLRLIKLNKITINS